MRDLSATLTKAQQASTIDALMKIVLTHNSTTYTYDKERILSINHPEEPYTQRAELVLDNSDRVLTDINLKGFEGVISYGAITTAGEEYSACAPLWVVSQTLDSVPGKLACILSLIGIPDLMEEDKASEAYTPDENDTKTVKTLLTEIITATLACFSHCKAYEVVFDSEDSMINTYQPKNNFRIAAGDSRISKIKTLLGFTECVMRAQADGKVHTFKPTTAGTDYDYEYNFESGHTFFGKSFHYRLVIPNKIKVQSHKLEVPFYSGEATDSESYALLPTEVIIRVTLESNEQAQQIAGAVLSRLQLWSRVGGATVPLNVGSEAFDYVNIVDATLEKKNRAGNIGGITRRYNAERAQWQMTFSFGSPSILRTTLRALGISGEDQAYFEYLWVKYLYAEHIIAGDIYLYWLDPDNTIDLDEEEFDWENPPEGENYVRVKTLYLDAHQVIENENTYYNDGVDTLLRSRSITIGTNADDENGQDFLYLKVADVAQINDDQFITKTEVKASETTYITQDIIGEETTEKKVVVNEEGITLSYNGWTMGYLELVGGEARMAAQRGQFTDRLRGPAGEDMYD